MEESDLSIPDRKRIPWGARVALFLLAFFLLLRLAFALVAPFGSGQIAAPLAAIVAAVLASVAMLRLVERKPLAALGFPVHLRAGWETAIGLIAGSLLVGAAALLPAMTGSLDWVRDTGSPSTWLALLMAGVAFYLVAAAAEEVLCRGYPFQVLVERLGVWPAVVVSSAVFSLLHLGNPNVGLIALANIFFAGVLLAVSYLRTRSLWFATGVHAGWNWMQGSVLDLPVSGTRFFDTPFYDAAERGADWWTGGAFGPEGGLAATGVVALGTAWLWRTRRLEPSVVGRAAGPLVEARMAALGK